MSDNQTAVAAVTAVPAVLPLMVSGTPGRYAGRISGRTAATLGAIAGKDTETADRRLFDTHNSTFRGRPRGRPV